ncbi:MAG: hypothetical protein WC721_02570 [Victivallaceae bacterium]|jgi:hypothetical protein
MKYLLICLCCLALNCALPAGEGVDVTAHVPDQFNEKTNDPKWLNSKESIGQIFVPSAAKISFLSIYIFRPEVKIAGVTPYKGPAPLALKLWPVKESLEKAKSDAPSAACSDEGSFDIEHDKFFEVNKELEPGQKYYFELSAPETPAPCYYYSYQYGGAPYADGSFYKGGNAWNGSALRFKTYQPLKFESGSIVVSNIPELVEICFNKKFDKSSVKAFIAGPAGTIKINKLWRNANTLLLYGKIPVYPTDEAIYKIYVNFTDPDTGVCEVHVFTFSYKKVQK